MEKSILISIRPEHNIKILNGRKIAEIRTSMPKCKLPCKVYIYCTKGKNRFDVCAIHNKSKDKKDYSFCEIGNGKVVAEFTLNKISKFDYDGLKFYDMLDAVLQNSCLTDEELCNYIQDKIAYSWKIDDLIVYDKPRMLKEFGLSRPPQSWCYVEVL